MDVEFDRQMTLFVLKSILELMNKMDYVSRTPGVVAIRSAVQKQYDKINKHI